MTKNAFPKDKSLSFKRKKPFQKLGNALFTVLDWKDVKRVPKNESPFFKKKKCSDRNGMRS